jgi:hypothetical protein
VVCRPNLRVANIDALPTRRIRRGACVSTASRRCTNQKSSRGDVEVQDEGSQLVSTHFPKRGEMAVDSALARRRQARRSRSMRNTGRLWRAFDTSVLGYWLLRWKLQVRLMRSGFVQCAPSADRTRALRPYRKCWPWQIDRVLVVTRRGSRGPWARCAATDLKMAGSRRPPRSMKCAAWYGDPGLEVRRGWRETRGRLVYATCSLLRAENEPDPKAERISRRWRRIVAGGRA